MLLYENETGAELKRVPLRSGARAAQRGCRCAEWDELDTADNAVLLHLDSVFHTATSLLNRSRRCLVYRLADRFADSL